MIFTCIFLVLKFDIEIVVNNLFKKKKTYDRVFSILTKAIAHSSMNNFLAWNARGGVNRKYGILIISSLIRLLVGQGNSSCI